MIIPRSVSFPPDDNDVATIRSCFYVVPECATADADSLSITGLKSLMLKNGIANPEDTDYVYFNIINVKYID